MIEFVRRGNDMLPPDSPIGEYPLFISRMLAARGLDTEEKIRAFLHPSMKDLSDPLLMPGMLSAKEILLRAQKERTPAVIYGDYDCDGVTASAIMKETLDELNIPCFVRLPDRHSEGYGLNEAAVREIAQQAKLLITVDNGITAVNEIALARELGMTVLLTDHHRPHEVIPEADAILCPTMGNYPYDAFCGAGVAWCVARVMLGEQKAKNLLDLCTLGTIADMVPLTGENRILAREGLKAIEGTRRPGLRELCKIAAVSSPLSGTDVAFRLAPRINACGRLESAVLALDLLTTHDPEQAAALAIRVNHLNEARRDKETDLITAADTQLSETDMVHRRAVVLWKEGWESGVVGLAAGRIAEMTGYPTVVFSVQGELAVGSARSAGDVDIHKALEKCADLLIRFGGHKAAAGMTLEAGKLPVFAERLSDAVKEQTGERPLYPRREYDADMTLAEATVPNIRLLTELEPFGTANPEPVFRIPDAETLTASRCGRDGVHLRAAFRQGRTERDAVGFNLGMKAEELNGTVTLLATPSINEFRGVCKPDLQLKAFRTGHDSLSSHRDQEDIAFLRDLSLLCGEKLPAADTVTPEGLTAFSELPQGVCVVCRTEEGTREALKAFPAFELCTGAARDRHAYNCVLYAGCMQTVTAPFDRILLWEGEAFPGEAALWQRQTHAQVRAAVQSAALRARLSALRYLPDPASGEAPGIPEMRSIYKALGRSADTPRVLAHTVGQTESRVLTALFIMEHMKLIRLTFGPLMAEQLKVDRSVRMDMSQDPLYRLLHFSD